MESLMESLHACTQCGKAHNTIQSEPCSKCGNTTFYYDIRHVADGSTVDQGNDSLGMGTTTKIFVWPDNSWVEVSEYSDVEDSWRGDDFYTLAIPEDKVGDMDEDIDAYISEHGQGNSLVSLVR